MDFLHASQLAFFEYRLHIWPEDWGNELRIIIFGDFSPPKSDLNFPGIGMTIEAGEIKSAWIRTARCVLNARVTTRDRSIEAVFDACSRINMFLGLVATLNFGNSGNGWWCYLTHEGGSGIHHSFNSSAIEVAANSLNRLPSRVRQKTLAALYWIREPRQMMMEGYRSDVFRCYAGYWNAFECLVEAVCLLRPQPKLSRRQKQEVIDAFVAQCGGKLDSEAIAQCYRRVVDQGFVAKASYALRICSPKVADHYIQECFEIQPRENRLYQIRNSINHGDVDIDDPRELIRIEHRHGKLWRIVFRMLGSVIAIPCPLDEP